MGETALDCESWEWLRRSCFSFSVVITKKNKFGMETIVEGGDGRIVWVLRKDRSEVINGICAREERDRLEGE